MREYYGYWYPGVADGRDVEGHTVNMRAVGPLAVAVAIKAQRSAAR